ncbi:uncharacterized protein LOC132902277 [Amyelois transitella]|uniref:uncharacterized protein LOC132902277 n=1 Tax=Amyelois transitella TaxID=680683 RepID=UPI00298F4130|nr:uncharacterized protein LOC132902277 [Amyelois transitella]XP_060802691.1 uncharacterized protein LOC132902277 [Amyelois transitella]
MLSIKKIVREVFFATFNKTSIHKVCSSLIGKLDSPESFLEALSKQMTTDNINMVFSTTKHQSDSPMWFELRYGRITGSTLYEAAHCRTINGSLLNAIMGEHSKFTSIAMSRGKILEKKVLKVVSKKEKIEIEEAGLLLNAEYPIFGATPDGLTENYTIEVKYPSTEAAILSYVKYNKITPKCCVPYDNSIVSVMNIAKKFSIDAVFPKLKDIYNI